MLFNSSPGDHFTFERRLSASWEALLKIKDYEEVRLLSSAVLATCSWLYSNRNMLHPICEPPRSSLIHSFVCTTRLLKRIPLAHKN
jgi:hypothetical protein